MTETWPKETIVSFIEGEDTTNVFTYSEKWQKHMTKLGVKHYADNGHGGHDYTIPKKWLRLPNKPSKAKSDAMKLRMANSANALFRPQNNGAPRLPEASTPEMDNRASSAARGAK